jgi:substrate-binding family protein
MIQNNVEELSAELHVQRFRKMGVLQHGEVHVPPARTGIGIASEITGSRLHSPYACDSGRDCRDAEVVARVVDRIAREELRAMLRITIGPFDEIPTVIFCGSDLIAMGAMSALEDAGVKIPEDVSIVGIDDISFAFLAPAAPYHDQRSS